MTTPKARFAVIYSEHPHYPGASIMYSFNMDERLRQGRREVKDVTGGDITFNQETLTALEEDSHFGKPA